MNPKEILKEVAAETGLQIDHLHLAERVFEAEHSAVGGAHVTVYDWSTAGGLNYGRSGSVTVTKYHDGGERVNVFTGISQWVRDALKPTDHNRREPQAGDVFRIYNGRINGTFFSEFEGLAVLVKAIDRKKNHWRVAFLVDQDGETFPRYIEPENFVCPKVSNPAALRAFN